MTEIQNDVNVEKSVIYQATSYLKSATQGGNTAEQCSWPRCLERRKKIATVKTIVGPWAK